MPVAAVHFVAVAEPGNCPPPLARDSVKKVATDPTSECAAPPIRHVHRSLMPVVFYAGLGLGLASNTVIHVDTDPGGYQDGWRTTSSFPDKAVHALAAFALTSVGVDLNVSPLKSATAVCVAGAAFEVTQGYVSAHDIAADCAGASLAAVWRRWRSGRQR